MSKHGSEPWDASPGITYSDNASPEHGAVAAPSGSDADGDGDSMDTTDDYVPSSQGGFASGGSNESPVQGGFHEGFGSPSLNGAPHAGGSASGGGNLPNAGQENLLSERFGSLSMNGVPVGGVAAGGQDPVIQALQGLHIQPQPQVAESEVIPSSWMSPPDTPVALNLLNINGQGGGAAGQGQSGP